jgi:tetratricopeptide (TPR) repeat protein
MSDHPTAAELDGLVRGELTREQARSVVRHLLRGCESCVAMIAPYASVLLDGSAHSRPLRPSARSARSAQSSRSNQADSVRASAEPARSEQAVRRAGRGDPAPDREAAQPDLTLLDNAYDRAIDRAFAAVMRHGENAARFSARVREVLAQLTAEGLESLRELPAELRGFAGYEALLERSWAMRREDPKQMVKLAELAALAAAGLVEEGFSAGQVHDFQARAVIELANAYRVMDRRQEAQASLDAARAHFRQGSQDRLLSARLFEVEASIYGDRGELEPACASLDAALRIYRRYGDPHLAGRSLIKKGLYVTHAGRLGEAIDLLTEGLEMIDASQDGPLVLAAVHNTAFCLMQSGRFREARSLLWRNLVLYEHNAGRQDRLKLRWLQAQIYAGLSDLARAERAFGEVRQGLRAAGKSLSEALVIVELAGVRLRQGRDEAARALALEAADLFLGLDLTREASAAAKLLKTSLERSAVQTPELVGKVMQLLRDWAPEEQPKLSARSA